jgi:hypothetical protein
MTQLAPRNFKQAESVRNQWTITPEYGTSSDALLDPAYWAHVSAYLRRGDIITALSEDNSYFSELLVLDAGKLFAKVCELRCVKITSAQMLNITVPEGYEIKFRGPRKWSVLRGKDVLKDDMEKQAAEKWLEEHLKAFGKAA